MGQPKILALAGSQREGSYNALLVQIAAEGARQTGATVTVLDLKEYPLPIFDEDVERESGTPENALRLHEIFCAHDGLLIASPEYNSSITPLLKNVIDWVSRKVGDGAPLAAYHGKYAALMAASPGGLGGLRGLVHVRAILGNIGVTVLPTQVAVPRAFEAFADSGELKDEKQQSAVLGLGKSLADTLQKISS